jgi:hypothetical protein
MAIGGSQETVGTEGKTTIGRVDLVEPGHDKLA